MKQDSDIVSGFTLLRSGSDTAELAGHACSSSCPGEDEQQQSNPLEPTTVKKNASEQHSSSSSPCFTDSMAPGVGPLSSTAQVQHQQQQRQRESDQPSQQQQQPEQQQVDIQHSNGLQAGVMSCCCTCRHSTHPPTDPMVCQHNPQQQQQQQQHSAPPPLPNSSDSPGDASSSSSASSGAYELECCCSGAESDASSSSTGAFLEVRESHMTEVVYVREGVSIWPSSNRRILGRLSLVKQHGILFMSWLPYSSTPQQQQQQPAAAVAASDGSSLPQSPRADAAATSAAAEATGAADGGSSSSGSSSGGSSSGGRKDASIPAADSAAAAAGSSSIDRGDDWEDAAVDVCMPGLVVEPQQQQQQHRPVLHTLKPPQQQQHHAEQPQPPQAAAPAAAATDSDRRSLYAVHPIPLSDVRALVTHTSHLSASHQLTLVLVSGLTLPPLFFKPGGVRQLLSVLRQHVRLARARDQPGTYLVNDTADPLQRSLVCLDLTDILLGAPPPGASSVAAPAEGPLANGAWLALEGGGHTTTSSSSSRRRTRNKSVKQQQHGADGSGSSGSSGSSSDGSPRGGGRGSLLSQVGWRPSLGSFGGGLSVMDQWAAATLELPTPAAAVAAAAAAAAAAATAATPWKGLGSSFKHSQLGAKLRHVGAAAVEGASSFMTAAVDGWASDVLRHFEQEVELQEQQQGSMLAAEDADGELVLVDDPEQQQQQLVAAAAPDQAPLAAAYTSAAAAAAQARSPSPPSAAAAAGDGQQVAETLVGAFEILEGVPADVLGCVLSAAKGPVLPPLGLAEFRGQFLDAEGVLVDEAGFRQWVFAAGVDPAARREVWKFLLGVYPPGSSSSSRAALHSQHEAGYAALQQQWHASSSSSQNKHRRRSQLEQQQQEQQQQQQQQQLQLQQLADGQQEQQQQQQQQQPPSQQADHQQQQQHVGDQQQQQQQADPQEVSGWRERRGHIDRDVLRTDRQHPFYKGPEASAHLSALRDVLRAYCCYNLPLGYCQGMSDLASPLLVVNEGDEVDTFWCFVALMDRLQGNFATDQQGMHQQLAALRQLVQVLDPQLHAFLEERDCLHYFFAFRWLLIHWKREFSFEQVLSLWEACWSCPLTRHLHLYLAAAVLIQHRRLLLSDPALDFDGLLAFAVERAGKLDLRALLQLAESLVVVSGPAGEHCCEGLP